MIVAWSIGGVAGPLLLAWLYEANDQTYGSPFTVIGIIAAVSIVLPLITRMPRVARERLDLGAAARSR